MLPVAQLALFGGCEPHASDQPVSIAVASREGSEAADELRLRTQARFDRIEQRLSNLADQAVPANRLRNYALPIVYGLVSASLPDGKEAAEAASKEQVGSTAWAVSRLEALLGDGSDKDATQIVEGIKSRLRDLFSGEFSISEHAVGAHAKIAYRFKLIQTTARFAHNLVKPGLEAQGLPSPFAAESASRANADESAAGMVTTAREAVGEGGIAELLRILAEETNDIVGTGLVAVVCHAHNRAWNPDDAVAASQVRTIAFATQFFAEAVMGQVKNGLPHINWPTLLMAIKEMYTLVRASRAEIAELEAVTATLLENGATLRLISERIGKSLVSHEHAHALVAEFKSTDRRLDDLTDFFEKD